MNFKLITCDAFRRFPRLFGEMPTRRNEAVLEKRPCIIGITEVAIAFIVARANKTLRPVFGPFYTGGCGECLFQGQWLPCLRLGSNANEQNTKGIIRHLEVLVRMIPQDVAVLNQNDWMLLDTEMSIEDVVEQLNERAEQRIAQETAAAELAEDYWCSPRPEGMEDHDHEDRLAYLAERNERPRASEY